MTFDEVVTPKVSEVGKRLLLDSQRRRMLANGRANDARIAEDGNAHNFWPVVKLFCPWGSAVWLLSELDSQDPDIAFGLCDLGMGYPELGSVRISELNAIQGPMGMRIERDDSFKACKSLESYADEALRLRRVKA